MYSGERRTAASPVRGPLPDGAGHRRPEVQRVRVRVGPVRRERQEGAGPNGEVLQLVLLLHQRGIPGRRDRAGVHPGQPRTEMGVRHLRLRHRGGASRVPVGDETVPFQEAGGESADAGGVGVRGGVEEEGLGLAVGSLSSLQYRRYRRRPCKQEEAKVAPQQTVPVSFLSHP